MNSQTKTTSLTPHSYDIQHLHDVLEQQKHAYLRYPLPTAKERIDRLARLKRILVKYQDQFAEAINQDYGNRSTSETKIGELLTCLEHIKYYSKHLTTWMKPSKRHVSIIHQPAKAWVQYQPLGVIGIITPWNYPLLLSIGPLICALAAGNHAMIKISSSSSNFGRILEKALSEAFPQELVSVTNGGGAISDAFCRLAFDKLIFTGSTNVGKTVMSAAAENLVPLILELGGKSPVLVHPSIHLRDVAQRIAAGKLWNAGQTCVAPDYMFLPKGKLPSSLNTSASVWKRCILTFCIIQTTLQLLMTANTTACKVILKMHVSMEHRWLKSTQPMKPSPIHVKCPLHC